jgi:hypothetical protein
VAVDETRAIGRGQRQDRDKGSQEGKQAFHGDRRSLTYLP